MLIAPHDRDRLFSYQTARDRGEMAPSHYEFDGIRRDGSLVQILSSVRPVSWNGESCLQSSMIDITEIERTRAALRTSRETLRTIVDAIPAMINAKDENHRYVMMNQYQAETFGVSGQDAIGKTATELIGAEQGEEFATKELLPAGSSSVSMNNLSQQKMVRQSCFSPRRSR